MNPDLEALGLSQDEADLYALLVDSPPMTRETLAAQQDSDSPPNGASLLARLDLYGLITSLAGEPERITATSPETALGNLAERRIAELTQAKDRVSAEFAQRWAKGGHVIDPRDLIEIIVGRSAIVQRVAAIEKRATHVVGFDKPPYAGGSTNPVQFDKLRTGDTTYRSIYDGTALEVPGRLVDIEEAGRLGEVARVAWGVPLKMIMADREIAVVPLEAAPTAIEVAALVHPSALLDSLYVLFEMYWERATPLAEISFTGELDSTARPQDRLVPLMVAGMTDKAIARQLGVTERSVQRWIKTIMAEHGANTRLQLGHQLAQMAIGSSGGPKA